MERQLIALVLAVAAVAAVQGLGARRGLEPPGFRDPVRRLLAGAALGFIFLFGVFAPAVTFDRPPAFDPESVSLTGVFALHALLLMTLAAWYGLGYLAVDAARVGVVAAAARQLGLRSRHLAGEIAVGLAAGTVAWFGVISASVALGVVLTGLGGGDALPQEPAPLIVWLAGLPVVVRLLISLSAGVVEELFFRGFLQPRVGTLLSTFFFACAHLGYGQPFLVFGITLLSLFYAWLAKWRRSVFASMAAHFLFDAVQLLVVIPSALRLYESGVVDG